ncbi:hypothetical protein HR060_06950 [Catenovulum sp. SM1970]|uniref:DUF6445 family protein n=1 Tax=Marinifaba aquimaris TaxID=2741323 RepID=UPI0015720F46|nr:DUF6445 family protein [Marinifaba aquimaris]NTS76604.1 hypothetical protein [Marinifaba aquimaris]
MEFKVNPLFRLNKIYLQDTEHFIVVIDDFLDNPDEVIAFAKEKAAFKQVGADGTLYPGIREAMPKNYIANLETALTTVISEHFYQQQPIKSLPPTAYLSLTTLAESDLNLYQKMPHVDCLEEHEFACVHYFCDQPHGGTSLYNFKAQNKIKLTTAERELMYEMVEAVKATPDEHKGYLNQSTSVFERVGQVQAQFNRLVVYPSNYLHCADIDPDISCINDIETGRLSVASFLGFSV